MRNPALPLLGPGVVLFGIFLLLVAIPYGISKPSNIRVAVLSPTFWPVIIACALIIIGLLLSWQAWRGQAQADTSGYSADPESEYSDSASDGAAGAYWRLLAMAVVMPAMIWAMPQFGMVWVAMISFVLFALIVRSPQPLLSLLIAVLLPIILYGFFNHIAGVAIPQGDFIRLP